MSQRTEGRQKEMWLMPAINEQAVLARIERMRVTGTLTQAHLTAIRTILGVDQVGLQAFPTEVDCTNIILSYIVLQRQGDELCAVSFLLNQGFDKKLLFYYLGGDEERGEIPMPKTALALRDFQVRCATLTSRINSEDIQFTFQYQRELIAGDLKTEGTDSWFSKIKNSTAQIDLSKEAIKYLILQYLRSLIECPDHLGKEELEKSGLIWMEQLVNISKLRETVCDLAKEPKPILSPEERDFLLASLRESNEVRIRTVERVKSELIEKAERLRKEKQLRALHLIIIAHLINRNDLCDRLKTAKGEAKETRAVFSDIISHIKEHAAEIGLDMMQILDAMLDLDDSTEANVSGIRILYKEIIVGNTERHSLDYAVRVLRDFINANRERPIFRKEGNSQSGEEGPKTQEDEVENRARTELRFGLDFSKLNLDQ